MYEVLLAIKAELENIANIKTCKIGLEDDISPNDYPLIRIVAASNDGLNYLHEKFTVKIYYGFDLNEYDGMEIIYEKLYALEKDIRDAIAPELTGEYVCKWKNTISDEDRLEGYKVLCSVFEVDS